MKLKLDENFDARLVPDLISEGFDADTVAAEGLSGSPDEAIYDTCKIGRSNACNARPRFLDLRFPPQDSEGIVVVRPPKAVLSAIRATFWSVLAQLKTGAAKGKLWIVEPGRIREHMPEEAADADS